MRKENIKRQPADFRKYADDSLNYKVKLKKFSLPTYENHASSASRHHAAGARRRSRRRIPRDSQILTAMTAAVRATTYNEHIMLTETNPIPNRAADCPGPTNHNGVSRWCPAAAIRSSKTTAATVPQLAAWIDAESVEQHGWTAILWASLAPGLVSLATGFFGLWREPIRWRSLVQRRARR
jgi:hypothetical protein